MLEGYCHCLGGRRPEPCECVNTFDFEILFANCCSAQPIYIDTEGEVEDLWGKRNKLATSDGEYDNNQLVSSDQNILP